MDASTSPQAIVWNLKQAGMTGASEEVVPWPRTKATILPNSRVLCTTREDLSTREMTGLSLFVSREAIQGIFPCPNSLFWHHLLFFFVYTYTKEEALKRKTNICLFSSLLDLL